MNYSHWTAGQTGHVSTHVFEPIIIDSDSADTYTAIALLLESDPCIEVLDTIRCQVHELIKSRNPGKTLSEEEIKALTTTHFGDATSTEFGTWFYYPWAKKVVHLLPKEEFIELRTNRNRNKITLQEQQRLSSASIGIVGLSVGRAIALTAAQERICGEIRLADFDHLELSNLNRLRASVFDIEQNKAVLTARAIAELDPYIKVRCFTDGLKEENMDAFFLHDGKLDIFIEECDGLDMKIKARIRAKELGIPVVMDTNDRGMLDVERFDLEPDRPLLHGKISGLDLTTLKPKMTTDEKVPFVASILGIDQMSSRMKASLMEVDQTIKSWPQLASSVSLGAALCTNICRRILLDQHTTSGRWLTDLEELIPTAEPLVNEKLNIAKMTRAQPLTTVAMHTRASQYLDTTTPPSEYPLSSTDCKHLVKAAMQSPSGGNSQPWHFLQWQGHLFLFLDPVRSFSTIDPGRRYAYFALGACLENIRIAASAWQKGIRINMQPQATDGLVAVITGGPKTLSRSSVLLPFLHTRCTNRKKGNALPLPPAIAEGLSKLDQPANTNLSLITDKSKIEQIARLCGQAEKIRMLNTTCHWDMFEREMRWTKEQTEATEDGVDLRTLELSFSDHTGLKVARDQKAMQLVKQWNGGGALEELTEKITKTSSAIGVISIPNTEIAHAIAAGSLLQRFWLQCTRVGIAVQPISAPAFMGLHHLHDEQQVLSPAEHADAAQVYDSLRALMDTTQNTLPFFLLRLSYAEAPTVRSLRRPINKHLTTLQTSHDHDNPELLDNSFLSSTS